MGLEEERKKIRPADSTSMERAKQRWMTVGKPLFSLGKLEDVVIRIAGMKRRPVYQLEKKGLVIFCADNGVVQEGVTQTGQEVTAIVAENFTKNAASVCMMSKVAGVDVFPVDIGMIRDVPAVTRPEYKVAYGTQDMAQGPAMTREQAEQAVLAGIRIAGELVEKDGRIFVCCGEGALEHLTVQYEGGKRMPARDFFRGHPPQTKENLSAQ